VFNLTSILLRSFASQANSYLRGEEVLLCSFSSIGEGWDEVDKRINKLIRNGG